MKIGSTLLFGWFARLLILAGGTMPFGLPIKCGVIIVLSSVETLWTGDAMSTALVTFSKVTFLDAVP
jgi:hypothetical protein